MLRLESLDPSFSYIEQINGNEGWVYQNRQLKNVSPERLNELKLSFIGGIFGLQQSVMVRTKILDIRETDNDAILVGVLIDDKSMGYIINKNDNSLLGNFVVKNGGNEITYFDDLKKQNNLLLPFKETTETNNGNVEIVYKNFTVDPVFDPKEWAKP